MTHCELAQMVHCEILVYFVRIKVNKCKVVLSGIFFGAFKTFFAVAPFGTFWHVLAIFGTFHFFSLTFSHKKMKLFDTVWDLLAFLFNVFTLLEPFGAISSHLESFRGIWRHLEAFGARLGILSIDFFCTSSPLKQFFLTHFWHLLAFLFGNGVTPLEPNSSHFKPFGVI